VSVNVGVNAARDVDVGGGGGGNVMGQSVGG
jgi:hypothetical protein